MPFSNITSENHEKLIVKCLLWKTTATICNYVILACLYRSIIMEPLSRDAVLLAHKDPTDIIAVPFPIANLRVFVTLSLLSTFLFTITYATKETSIQSSPSSLLGKARQQHSTLQHVYELSIHVFSGTLILFVIAIVSGASPWVSEHVEHTFWGMLYMSVISFGPSFSFGGNRKQVQQQYQQQTRHESGVGSEDGGGQTIQKQLLSCDHYIERINQSVILCTIILTVPWMILLILDWGIQSQRWPVPILLGNTIGHGVGMIIGILLAWGDWLFFRGRSRQTTITTSMGDESKYS